MSTTSNQTTSSRRRTRRTVVRTLAVACAVGALPAVASASAQAAPYCGITWGSLAKSATPMVRGPITNVRAGQHACYDRLVIDLAGTASPGYDIRYVNNVYTDGAGTLVPLRGGAKLQVVTRAPAYGTGSFRPANTKEVVNVTGYRTFRQVAWAGSFEGQTTMGVGVRARLPFRAFVLKDATTTRLVIDVAHAW